MPHGHNIGSGKGRIVNIIINNAHTGFTGTSGGLGKVVGNSTGHGHGFTEGSRVGVSTDGIRGNTVDNILQGVTRALNIVHKGTVLMGLNVDGNGQGLVLVINCLITSENIVAGKGRDGGDDDVTVSLQGGILGTRTGDGHRAGGHTHVDRALLLVITAPCETSLDKSRAPLHCALLLAEGIASVHVDG